jgi:putative FmdB family regulatory protein
MVTESEGMGASVDGSYERVVDGLRQRRLALGAGECQLSEAIVSGAMPIYEYRCKKSHTFDVKQEFGDDAIDICEVCGAPASRIFRAPAVHFKGSGFYNTDYGTRKRSREKEAHTKAESAAKSKESKESKTSSDSSSSTSSDSSSSSKSDSGSSKSSEKKAKAKAD